MTEFSGEDMIKVLVERYKEPEAHAKRMLWIAVTFDQSTAPHPGGFIRVEPAGPGLFTLDEEFKGMKIGGNRI